MNLRILIVDDSVTMRRITATIVSSRPGWTVCGEAEDGLSGIEVGKRVSEINDKVPLGLFTGLDVEWLQAAARRAGICQVIPKAKVWSLIQGIETAVNQSPELKQQTPDISE
jgi:hypothetical protein